MKLLIAVVAVSGCVTMTPTQQAQVTADSQRRVTCEGKDDCELKWATALRWVQDNSYWKLRAVTDSVITTEGPLDSPSAAFSITKFPLGRGAYEIQFRAGCGNMFGCVPAIEQLAASFKNEVSGAVLLQQGWSLADRSAFIDRCSADTRKVRGDARNARQIDYGCNCLANGLESRYSVRALGDVARSDPPGLKHAMDEINAGCADGVAARADAPGTPGTNAPSGSGPARSVVIPGGR